MHKYTYFEFVMKLRYSRVVSCSPKTYMETWEWADSRHPKLKIVYGQYPRKTGGVLATKVFWGSMGCLGGYILGWFTSD